MPQCQRGSPVRRALAPGEIANTRNERVVYKCGT